MLVLNRKKNERIVIDGPCVIQVCEIRDVTVRLGIIAARDVNIAREELLTPNPEPIARK